MMQASRNASVASANVDGANTGAGSEYNWSAGKGFTDKAGKQNGVTAAYNLAANTVGTHKLSNANTIALSSAIAAMASRGIEVGAKLAGNGVSMSRSEREQWQADIKRAGGDVAEVTRGASAMANYMQNDGAALAKEYSQNATKGMTTKYTEQASSSLTKTKNDTLSDMLSIGQSNVKTDSVSQLLGTSSTATLNQIMAGFDDKASAKGLTTEEMVGEIYSKSFQSEQAKESGQAAVSAKLEEFAFKNAMPGTSDSRKLAAAQAAVMLTHKDSTGQQETANMILGGIAKPSSPSNIENIVGNATKDLGFGNQLPQVEGLAAKADAAAENGNKVQASQKRKADNMDICRNDVPKAYAAMKAFTDGSAVTMFTIHDKQAESMQAGMASFLKAQNPQGGIGNSAPQFSVNPLSADGITAMPMFTSKFGIECPTSINQPKTSTSVNSSHSPIKNSQGSNASSIQPQPDTAQQNNVAAGNITMTFPTKAPPSASEDRSTLRNIKDNTPDPLMPKQTEEQKKDAGFSFSLGMIAK